MSSQQSTPQPGNVPDKLVYDFDVYNIPGSTEDVHAAYAAVQRQAPAIFWTPHNGGHWVATRGEDVVNMQRDYKHFSHRHIVLPPMPDGIPRMIPIEMDPPEHARFRRPVLQGLMHSVIAELESTIVEVAETAIEKVFPQGECEFVQDFAKILPIHVFMKLVDVPFKDKDLLLSLVETSVRSGSAQARVTAQQTLSNYLMDRVRARRETPGDDFISRIANTDIAGERIKEEDALACATLVMQGGLDTVSGMLSFIARFLALHPEHRHQLVARLDDEAYLKQAIEELVRRHGMANTARVITEDMEYKGIHFRAGDRILPINTCVGLDDHLNDNPMTVDFDRAKPVHATFGNGPHACPGAPLARLEIRKFLQLWLRRIPDFRIKPGTKPVLATGLVNGVLRMELVWP